MFAFAAERGRIIARTPYSVNGRSLVDGPLEL
jgi:hypothetical protein